MARRRIGRFINDSEVDPAPIIDAINEHTEYEAERITAMRVDVYRVD